MVNIQKIQQVPRIPSRSQEKNTTGRHCYRVCILSFIYLCFQHTVEL